jgi:hypothetical protein
LGAVGAVTAGAPQPTTSDRAASSLNRRMG